MAFKVVDIPKKSKYKVVNIDPTAIGQAAAPPGQPMGFSESLAGMGETATRLGAEVVGTEAARRSIMPTLKLGAKRAAPGLVIADLLGYAGGEAVSGLQRFAGGEPFFPESPQQFGQEMLQQGKEMLTVAGLGAPLGAMEAATIPAREMLGKAAETGVEATQRRLFKEGVPVGAGRGTPGPFGKWVLQKPRLKRVAKWAEDAKNATFEMIGAIDPAVTDVDPIYRKLQKDVAMTAGGAQKGVKTINLKTALDEFDVGLLDGMKGDEKRSLSRRIRELQKKLKPHAKQTTEGSSMYWVDMSRPRGGKGTSVLVEEVMNQDGTMTLNMWAGGRGSPNKVTKKQWEFHEGVLKEVAAAYGQQKPRITKNLGVTGATLDDMLELHFATRGTEDYMKLSPKGREFYDKVRGAVDEDIRGINKLTDEVMESMRVTSRKSRAGKNVSSIFDQATDTMDIDGEPTRIFSPRRAAAGLEHAKGRMKNILTPEQMTAYEQVIRNMEAVAQDMDAYRKTLKGSSMLRDAASIAAGSVAVGGLTFLPNGWIGVAAVPLDLLYTNKILKPKSMPSLGLGAAKGMLTTARRLAPIETGRLIPSHEVQE